MANDPKYDAVLDLAGVHLESAYDAFRQDERIPWRDLPGNAPKVREQVWVDALKQALANHQRIERLLSM